MPISQASMMDWRCTHCGEATLRLTWLAIDAVERPDLTARLADLIEFDCPRCLHPVRRSQPLLVLRLANAAPLLAARATNDETDPLQSLGETVADVQRELGNTLDEVPGPAAVVTFAEIEAGTQGDIDADLEAFQAGVDGGAAHTPAYRSLLTKVAATQQQQRIGRALEALALVGSEAELHEVARRCPEGLTDQAERLITQHAEEAVTEGQRQFAVSMLETVRLVRQGDFSGAWAIRESLVRTFWEETIAPRLRALDAAWREVDWSEVARLGQELLDVLRPGAHPELQVDVALCTATALVHDEGPDRGHSAEDAIKLGQFALSVLDAVPDIDTPQRRIPIVSNLGTAFGFRPRGDPAWNSQQAISYLTDAIELSQESGDRDGWAMAQTNLANALINRGGAGDYDRAREHLGLALTHRSRQRSAGDWAFTQLHLGLAYSRDDSGDRAANLRRAILHFANARDAARSAGDTPLLAQAEHNLAVEQLALSRMPGTAPDTQSGLLDRADVSALESLRLSPISESPPRFGRAWLMIGKVRAARPDRRGAIEAFKKSLTALSANTAPSEARQASRLLLELAEAEGETELAADAAAQLVDAAAAVIAARSRAEDRMSEQRGPKTTDFRFAAHALVRAGRLEEAVAALEHARTRELGLLTLSERIDFEALSYIDPSLRAEVDELTTALRTDILTPDERSGSSLAERFERVRGSLQQTPTFEGALDPPTLDEVGEVAQPGWPLVYLGSAPNGSFALIVEGDGSGNTDLEAILAPECGSGAIAQLLFGYDGDGNPLDEAKTPYLLAQLGAPDELDGSIAMLSSLVGQHLLRPLAAVLARKRASGVTLVSAGALGLMPIHAITWHDRTGRRRSLIDDFDVAYAPSAQLQRACLWRASERDDDAIRFVGVANPLPSPKELPEAEREIEAVKELVPIADSVVLRRENATKQRVLDALVSATHVHFACHGAASFFGQPLSAALALAGEDRLSALEIARTRIPARLVVASACETGVLQGYEEADESLSLASAFIAAGAASVVSTLWSVDDLAAALIMTRFYEGLFGDGKSPAAALREAQLWMRDADSDVIDAYISSRTALRELRSAQTSSSTSDGAGSFGAPSCWAAFVLSGA